MLGYASGTMAENPSSTQRTARSAPRDAERPIRTPSAGAILLTAVGAVFVVGCAAVLSYNGIYQIAVQGNVSEGLAHLYPGIFIFLLLMAFWASFVLRAARPAHRRQVDLVILGLIAVAAGASALWASGARIVEGIAVVAAAVLPWLAALVAFLLFMRVWRHVNGELDAPRRRPRPAGRRSTSDMPRTPPAGTARPVEAETEPVMRTAVLPEDEYPAPEPPAPLWRADRDADAAGGADRTREDEGTESAESAARSGSADDDGGDPAGTVRVFRPRRAAAPADDAELPDAEALPDIDGGPEAETAPLGAVPDQDSAPGTDAAAAAAAGEESAPDSPEGTPSAGAAEEEHAAASAPAAEPPAEASSVPLDELFRDTSESAGADAPDGGAAEDGAEDGADRPELPRRDPDAGGNAIKAAAATLSAAVPVRTPAGFPGTSGDPAGEDDGFVEITGDDDPSRDEGVACSGVATPPLPPHPSSSGQDDTSAGPLPGGSAGSPGGTPGADGGAPLAASSAAGAGEDLGAAQDGGGGDVGAADGAALAPAEPEVPAPADTPAESGEPADAGNTPVPAPELESEPEPEPEAEPEPATEPTIRTPRPSIPKRPMVLKPRRGPVPGLQAPEAPPASRVRSGPLPPDAPEG
ncbi:hypothetical protein GCM10027440_17980 [Nocardiopsis coralliicola]